MGCCGGDSASNIRGMCLDSIGTFEKSMFLARRFVAGSVLEVNMRSFCCVKRKEKKGQRKECMIIK